ncbi:MAG: peptide chain release factor N(5)-glutamine methyltransferase [Candidatus Scalindua sp.]
MHTIRNIRKWAITTLKESGIEFPETDADTLLAYVLSCDRTRIYTNPDDVIDDADIRKYKEFVYKRTSHVPLQYITRRVEFMSLDFVVDERVLIPRPETEILVETVLNKAQDNEFPDKSIIIMEIGTGSGNISVSLAKNLSNAEIYTNDISPDALTLAQTNIQRHEVVDKVHLLHGDFFGAFCGSVEKEHADFIVSNPPYVSESEWNKLEPEVREHEPRQALVGGEDGLCFYREIIKDSTDWLRPGGYLVIEIGETQANAIKKLMKNELNYEEIEIIKDLQGKERIISARRK